MNILEELHFEKKDLFTYSIIIGALFWFVSAATSGTFPDIIGMLGTLLVLAGLGGFLKRRMDRMVPVGPQLKK
ncbi:MAG: hypothetical protein Q7R64_01680 [bacterium]|nr:hypothetical protein [bacterium]